MNIDDNKPIVPHLLDKCFNMLSIDKLCIVERIIPTPIHGMYSSITLIIFANRYEKHVADPKRTMDRRIDVDEVQFVFAFDPMVLYHFHDTYITIFSYNIIIKCVEFAVIITKWTRRWINIEWNRICKFCCPLINYFCFPLRHFSTYFVWKMRRQMAKWIIFQIRQTQIDIERILSKSNRIVIIMRVEKW